MKVLFPFVGDSVGGSHLSAIELGSSLHAHGIEVVFGVHQDGPMKDELRRRGIRPVSLPRIRCVSNPLNRPYRLMWPFLYSRRMRSFINDSGFDIVHTNDSRMNLSWLLPCASTTCKHVWHQRNPFEHSVRSLPASFATSVITISEYCQRSMSPIVQRRSCVLDNPVSIGRELNDSNEVPDSHLDSLFDSGEAVIGGVANWIPRKRLPFLASVYVELRKRGIGARLVILGRVPTDERRIAEAVIGEELLDRDVCFLGFVSPVHPWLSRLSVLVVPAVNEGFGRTIPEAMLCGTPVVASDNAGHREIIEDGVNGYLVGDDDVGGFADRVESILSDPDSTRAVIPHARELALKRFDPNVHASRVLEIYTDILRRS